MKTVKEVARFEEAKAALQNFCASHGEVFAQYEELAQEYNDALEQANQAVRSRGIENDDFKISRSFDDYDADKLYELVGRDTFLELGGSITTERKLTVDKVKLRSHILSERIPKEIAALICSHQRKYTTPKPLRILT